MYQLRCALPMVKTLLLIAISWFATFGSRQASCEESAKQAEEFTEVNFADLQIPQEKGAPVEATLIPDRLKKLGGRRVRLTGFIIPQFTETFDQFVLTETNTRMNSGAISPDELVIVSLKKGDRVRYTHQAIHLTGTFSISPFKDKQGKQIGIFHLEDAELEK